MTTAHIKKVTTKHIKDSKYIFWWVVRIISTFGPIILTYVFAKGVEALENGEGFDAVIKVFLFYLFIESAEHFLRLGSKTRIAAYTETMLVEIQADLIDGFDESSPHRRELVQSIRNYTKAVRDFITYFYTNGIQGVVSFVAIPIILFFIDVRVFILEMILMVIYLLVTVEISKRYEKSYEKFDKSREYYFAALQSSNSVENEAGYIKKNIMAVQNIVFLNWVTLQHLISIFNFFVVFIYSKDVIRGFKQISDLVLVAGYTKETKTFLNNVTGSVEKFMEVTAGAERVVAMAKKESLSIHRS